MRTIALRHRQFDDIYRGKRVLVTGHTGFKGSWLCAWLNALGADVMGYSLSPDTTPNHFELIQPDLQIKSVFGDIRDLPNLEKTWQQFQPEVVFHLAAQPLVRLSYEQPIETLNINIMGTANVLEACRQTTSIRAIINITSDKCYENREWVWGYRESDPMGGYDPYSASKGCAELVTAAYRKAFFNPDTFGASHHVLLASARAGNVIGGGDWARDRIITDMMTAAAKDTPFLIRSPGATRPWQHVLEPLSGYLLLGRHLLKGKRIFADAWNFGPVDGKIIPVIEMVRTMQKIWPKIGFQVQEDPNNLHEAGLLKLDCSKAVMKLGWEGVWDGNTTFAKTAQWYKKFYENGTVSTIDQMTAYFDDAFKAGLPWIGPNNREP